jgi:hypothetical protein
VSDWYHTGRHNRCFDCKKNGEKCQPYAAVPDTPSPRGTLVNVTLPEPTEETSAEDCYAAPSRGGPVDREAYLLCLHRDVRRAEHALAMSEGGADDPEIRRKRALHAIHGRGLQSSNL